MASSQSGCGAVCDLRAFFTTINQINAHTAQYAFMDIMDRPWYIEKHNAYDDTVDSILMAVTMAEKFYAQNGRVETAYVSRPSITHKQKKQDWEQIVNYAGYSDLFYVEDELSADEIIKKLC